MPIFFDIDDTLLDDKYAVSQACMAIQKKFSDKVKVPKEEFLKVWNEALHDYFDLYLEGKITFQEQRLKRVAKVFELNENQKQQETADEIFQVYLQEYENNWRLFTDVKPCLKKLKNKTLGIISNGDFNQQIKKLKKTGIENYFSSINISSKVGYAKPEKRIFEYACKSLNSDPKDCVYIGDKLEKDAIASEQIGMTGIWLNRSAEKKETGKIKVIYNLNDLPAFLE
jgi:putative hydrolase of the HAD superfamily